MRATALMFAAALLLLGQPLAAQTPEGAAPAKDKPPAMRGRLGSVSPDEARRAERARKRAAASHKPERSAAQPAVDKKRAAPPPEPPREAAAPREEKPVKEARPREAPEAAPEHPLHTARVPHRDRVVERPRHERAARIKRPRYARVRPDDRPVRTRRVYAGVPQRWNPRVGATVPRGVRLYPLPPGYYAPGPGYVYGAAEVPQRHWYYAPQPVYGGPAMPYYEGPETE